MPNSQEEQPQTPSSDFHILSIVVPVYNEEGNLRQLLRELDEVLESLELECEIVFVDDGSSDQTWETIESLHKKNNLVKGPRH
jgi:dolichol-phosphate mannosyltransferase